MLLTAQTPRLAPTLRFRQGRRTLVSNAQVPEALRGRWLSAGVLADAERLPSAPGRLDLGRAETPLGPVFVKRCAGRPGWHRLRFGRAERAFRLGRRMCAAGIRTPEPLAWVEGEDGAQELVTRFVPGIAPLALAPAHALDGLVRGVTRLHLAGFRHRDLKAPNLLIDAAQGSAATPWVLDLDGAARASAPPRRRTRVRDAGRLAASMLAAADEGWGEDAAQEFARRLRARVDAADERFEHDVLAWARAKQARNAARGLPLA